MEHYHSLIIKNLETDDFLMDYDNDFDEPRLFELMEDDFEHSLPKFIEKIGLNLSSYSKISDISHLDDNNIETIWLVYVEHTQSSNNFKKYPKEQFLKNIQNSSILTEITKNIILNNTNA